jgi:hypothetical protein
MTMVSRVLIAFNLMVVARGRYLGHVDTGYSPRPGWLYHVYWFVGQWSSVNRVFSTFQHTKVQCISFVMMLLFILVLIG